MTLIGSGGRDSPRASPRENTGPASPWTGKPGTGPASSAGQACGSKRFNYAQRAWTCILSGAYGVEGCINGEVQTVLFMRAVKNTQDRLIPRLLRCARNDINWECRRGQALVLNSSGKYCGRLLRSSRNDIKWAVSYTHLTLPTILLV